MISRQEGDLLPWTSESWFSLSLGQGEGGPPEWAPPHQAEGQCQPLFAGLGVLKDLHQPQRWKGRWTLPGGQRLSQCCHLGPSRTQATQLWSPSFKQMGENGRQYRVCLLYHIWPWGGGPSHSSPDPQEPQSSWKAGMGADKEGLTFGSRPQAQCMWDSARRGLGSEVRTSSSESLLGDVSPPEERLQETRTQRPQASLPRPSSPPQPGKEYL